MKVILFWILGRYRNPVILTISLNVQELNYTKNISPVQKSCFSTPLVLQTCGKEIDACLSKRSFLSKKLKRDRSMHAQIFKINILILCFLYEFVDHSRSICKIQASQTMLVSRPCSNQLV
jgi:hypothetical protein